MIIFFYFLFFLALGQQLYRLYPIFLRGGFVDFQVYWEATKAALIGKDVYRGLYSGGTPFNYPPTFLSFFAPFTFFPKSIASLVFLFISLAALSVSIFLLVKFQFGKKERTVAFLLSAVFFIQYFPTKFTLTLGQINLIFLFLTILSFYAFRKGKDILSGVSLAIAALLKIFPGFLILFFFKEKRWKAIFSFLATLILIVVLTGLFFGPNLFSDYFATSSGLFLKAGSPSYFDQSLNGFLSRLNCPSSWRLVLRLTSSLVLIVMFLRIKDQAISFFGLMAVITIFFSSFAWLHHYVVLIPLMIILFSKLYRRDAAFWLKLALLLAYLLCSFHFRNPQISIAQNIFLASHPFIGAITLLFLAKRIA